ncbi:MAG: hypothetical protein KGN33_11910 [Paracoccaceae bacterium]|nr:hypothetical protein [Paracoccaceae bacterium]
MQDVTVLRPVERLSLDPVRIAAIYRDFGPGGAETVIARALNEMALLVPPLGRAYDGGDFAEFSRGLARLQRLADRSGLAGLSFAALAVADCATHGDATALAATWDRLTRLIELAMETGAGLRGLSG